MPAPPEESLPAMDRIRGGGARGAGPTSPESESPASTLENRPEFGEREEREDEEGPPVDRVV